MKNKQTYSFISLIKFIFFILLGIFLFYLAFKGNNPQQLLNAIYKTNVFWILLAQIPAILAFISRAMRWSQFVDAIGYQLKYKNSYHALMIGYLANLGMPRVGEVVRCAIANQTDKVPVNKLIGTVIAERLVDVIMLFLCLLLTLLTNLDTFGDFFIEKVFAPLSDKLSRFGEQYGFLAVIILALSFFVLLRFRRKMPLFKKFYNLTLEIKEGLRALFLIKQKGLFIFHTLFIWCMYYLMTYVSFFAVKETAHLGLTEALFIVVVGGFGMSAPIQGGIGAYHYMVSIGLTLFGIVPIIDASTGEKLSDPGLVYATVVHASQTILMLLLGGISLLAFFILKRKNSQSLP